MKSLSKHTTTRPALAAAAVLAFAAGCGGDDRLSKDESAEAGRLDCIEPHADTEEAINSFVRAARAPGRRARERRGTDRPHRGRDGRRGRAPGDAPRTRHSREAGLAARAGTIAIADRLGRVTSTSRGSCRSA
jgi:hypothetical protein